MYDACRSAFGMYREELGVCIIGVRSCKHVRTYSNPFFFFTDKETFKTSKKTIEGLKKKNGDIDRNKSGREMESADEHYREERESEDVGRCRGGVG